MRKFFLLVASMILIPVILMGCQSNGEYSNIEISKVSVSNSKGFGNVNVNFFVVFEDEETLKTFQNAFTNAVKQEGIVDMIEPEFDLEVIYKDGSKQEYHLWVGEKDKKSTLMNIENTHTVYFIPEEITNQLIDLVN